MIFAARRLWPKSLFGKAGVVFGFAGLLLAVAWVVALTVTEHRLAEAIKVSEAEFGLPNSVEALLGPQLPPEKNAAVPLDEAARLMHDWLAASISRVGDAGVAHQFDDDLILRSQVMGPEIDALLAEADRRTEYATRSPNSPFPQPPVPLFWRRAIVWGEAFACGQLELLGRPEDSLRRLLRSLRISRKWTSREPDVLETRVNLSDRQQHLDRLNELLRRHKFPATIHDEVDAELAEQGKCRQTLAFHLQFDKLKRLEGFADHPKRQAIWWMIRPIADNDRLFIVETCNRSLRASQRPRYEVRAEIEADAVERNRISSDPWLGLWHPDPTSMSVPELHMHCDIHESSVRCLRVVNALAKRGDWNSPLDSLSLPEECLTVLYGGGRIKVKMKPAGPVVYSIGPDLRDDGGDVVFNRDVGFGPEEPPTRFP